MTGYGGQAWVFLVLASPLSGYVLLLTWREFRKEVDRMDENEQTRPLEYPDQPAE